MSLSATAATAAATITDDDPVVATIVPTRRQQRTGDTQSTVTLTGGMTAAVAVTYETGGDATSGDDYSRSAGIWGTAVTLKKAERRRGGTGLTHRDPLG